MGLVCVPEQMGCSPLGHGHGPVFFLGLNPNQYRIGEQGEQWLAWRASGWSADDVAAEANHPFDREVWSVAHVEAFFVMADKKSETT